MTTRDEEILALQQITTEKNLPQESSPSTTEIDIDPDIQIEDGLGSSEALGDLVAPVRGFEDLPVEERPTEALNPIQQEQRIINSDHENTIRVRQVMRAGREAVIHTRWLKDNGHPPPGFLDGDPMIGDDVFSRRYVAERFLSRFLSEEEQQDLQSWVDIVEYGRVRTADEGL